MRTSFRFALAALATLAVVRAAAAQEKKITRADLPPAVEKTVAAQSQGATIRGFAREVEKGKTYYEAEMTVNGRGKDMLMDASGAVVEVEEEVALDSLPGAVRTGLTAAAGKGKIARVESLTRQGKLVAYEAQVVTDGKRSEIAVDLSGKPITGEP
jgi:uncharacterized membrane protein YkoI